MRVASFDLDDPGFTTSLLERGARLRFARLKPSEKCVHRVTWNSTRCTKFSLSENTVHSVESPGFETHALIAARARSGAMG